MIVGYWCDNCCCTVSPKGEIFRGLRIYRCPKCKDIINAYDPAYQVNTKKEVTA